jgi:Spx/MgsR family transcriptional regulator
MKLYGIPNCDTVKKARDWFKNHNIEYEFHNFKTEGVSTEKLKEWDKKAGYEKFLNKSSATWKQLPEEVKQSVKTKNDAFALIQQHTSMIKRPVIEKDGFLFFGFDEGEYEKQLLNFTIL